MRSTIVLPGTLRGIRRTRVSGNTAVRTPPFQNHIAWTCPSVCWSSVISKSCHALGWGSRALGHASERVGHSTIAMVPGNLTFYVLTNLVTNTFVVKSAAGMGRMGRIGGARGACPVLAAAARRAGALVSSRAVAPRRMPQGAAFWSPVRRPRPAAARRGSGDGLGAPYGCACCLRIQRLYHVGLRCTGMRRRAVCAKYVCSAIVRTYMPGGYDHDAAIRARAHARYADAHSGPALHAPILRPITLLHRALRDDHNRDCVALLPMCAIAHLPCACKRCAYLRPAYECAALVQAFAHVPFVGAPRAHAPCAQTTLAPMLLRCNVRRYHVCARAARACAVRSGALCLCRP